MEIGAGLGAPSLTAAHRGARKVALTDVDPTAVRNAAYNASMNLGGEVSCKIACAAHNWDDDDDDSYSDSDDDGAGTCSLGRALSRAGFRFDRGGVDEGEDRVLKDGAATTVVKKVTSTSPSTWCSARMWCTSRAWPAAWLRC